MKYYKVSIATGNDAFQDDPKVEIARILRDLADHIDAAGAGYNYTLRDVNGNRVGHAYESDC